MSFIKQY